MPRFATANNVSSYTRRAGGIGGILSDAIAALGTAPLHYWDFTTNRALFNSVDVGGVTSTPGWSFTRASTGYAQDVAGNLISFGSGVLRRTNKGALIEGAGTNLCLQSQTFGTTWTVVGSAQSADQFVAPDATTTGDQITATAGLSAHYTTQNFTWTAAVHSVSVYVKYVNNRWFAITTFDGTTSRNASFDLLNGVVGALSNATSTIMAVGGGWYRCTMTGSTAMAAAAGNIAFNVNATNVATNESYTALGTEIVGLWGAQIEASGISTSYIPTTTASATRAADLPSITGLTGLAYPLSLYAEYELPALGQARWALAVYATGTATDSAVLSMDASNQFSATSYAATVWNGQSVGGAGTANVTLKHAGRFSASSQRSAYNGTLNADDTSMTAPASPTTVTIATQAGSGNPLNGYIRKAAIFNSALNDAALQRAST